MKVPKELVPQNDPVLRSPAAEVNTEDKALLADLARGLDRAIRQTSGIGLALPQLGVGLRGFMLRDNLFAPRAARFCFNPQILESSPERADAEEGCLSIPRRSYVVNRPKSVKVQYHNASGVVVVENLRGLPARAFQHELDHLDGLLIDRFPEVGAPRRETISPISPPALDDIPQPMKATTSAGAPAVAPGE